MQFFIYPVIVNDQYCSFEEFNGKERCICGKPSYGQVGSGKNRKPLCEEHFNYVMEINGKNKSDDIKQLSDREKRIIYK